MKRSRSNSSVFPALSCLLSPFAHIIRYFQRDPFFTWCIFSQQLKVILFQPGICFDIGPR